MSNNGRLLAIFIIILAGIGVAGAGATDPKPPTNDFIVRAPAAEIAGIASRNGLTVISQVDTPTDPQGRSVYLMRADPADLPEVVIDDVSSLEPTVAGIEEVFLASLPELDQSGMVILDATAVASALGGAHGFAPPSATVDATWNLHLHDREIKAGANAVLTFEFESPAGTDPADYSLEVEFDSGATSSWDPASCLILFEPTLDLAGSYGKWQLINASDSPLTLDSVDVTWPTLNGLLLEVRLDGTKIHGLSFGPPSALIDSQWYGSSSNRVIEAGDSVELKLKWLLGSGDDPEDYSLSVTTSEGPAAPWDPAGGPCVTHASQAVTIDGHEVSWDLDHHGDADLILDSATLTWPAANGKLLAARLDNESLLDEPYQEFGKDAAGDDRLVWQAYVNQAAAQQLEVDEAQKDFGGEATVAIIDTGIDPNHPLLAHRVIPGYDFVNDVAGFASETADIDQSGMVILDQSGMVILDGDHLVPLNQSGMVILDEDQESQLDVSTLPPAFGHGTMVAGVVHRVAPEASIMPLKAFTPDGHGNLYDIVDAIYYAVDNGANVINMSFSLETYSPELMRAINYAARNGVACVASAGNAGEETLIFPASFGNAIGVASTNDADELSAFSNWGSDLVTIAAPGENIVTTFPGGGWALASGTSFAAPWISGAAAIFADKLGKKHDPGKADFYLSSNALADADEIVGDGSGRCGYGRANLRKAVERVKSGRYAADKPLGIYTLSATFAEGCSASYPPPGGGSGCFAEGSGQLRFENKKVLWTLTNMGEADIELDGLTLVWPAENGPLKRIKANGEEIDNAVHPETSATVTSGWLGVVDDRILSPHQSVEILFEFEQHVLWTY